MKPWWKMRFWWLVMGLGVLNILLLFVWAQQGRFFLGSKVSLLPGMRSDLLNIERPWLDKKNQKNEMDTAGQEGESKTSLPSKIDLKQGREQLSKALSAGENKVDKEVTVPLECRLWGPLLAGEVVRVSDALAKWSGNVSQTQKREAVGYMVYLPKAIVDQGVGLAQLQAKGVSEVYFMGESTDLPGTISLGFFRDLDRAQIQQKSLQNKGIENVAIQPRFGAERSWFELHGTVEEMKALDAIYRLSRRGKLQACEVASSATSAGSSH